MKLIRPISITSSIYTSDNIDETYYVDDAGVDQSPLSAYNAGSTYAAGDLVYYTSGGIRKVYESQLAGNIGQTPDSQPSGSPLQTWWLEVSYANDWMPFDQRIAQQCTNPTSIQITLQPGEICNAVACFNLNATNLNITVTDLSSPSDGEIYNSDYDLVDNDAVVDWWAYFYEPITRRPEIAVFDLPNYANTQIVITISVPSASPQNDAKVGEVVVGRQADIGWAVMGSSVSFIDYSRKARDDFGNAVITERDYADRVDFDIRLYTVKVGSVKRMIAGYRATPAVYYGEDISGYATLIYGYPVDFEEVISTNTISDCTLRIEGLT